MAAAHPGGSVPSAIECRCDHNLEDKICRATCHGITPEYNVDCYWVQHKTLTLTPKQYLDSRLPFAPTAIAAKMQPRCQATGKGTRWGTDLSGWRF
ncbi:hypothetical protein Pan189_08930 [Stratiformator vulcanicus]|uniref:Uncharacterized protein n=1 Tax=Stratiformator vulcanicus TaxID=2527980 RepID=A0A517QY50_9PLAN|nr:hypothetical protein Pan189_08930 [Stratiformator vulcanicus]